MVNSLLSANRGTHGSELEIQIRALLVVDPGTLNTVNLFSMPSPVAF
jgi:hypothetical protein